MIVIKGLGFTTSQVIDILRQAMTGWKEQYASYVVKIAGSGTQFSQYIEVEDAVREYVAGEPKDDQPKLALYRGKAPVATSAVSLKPLDRAKVRPEDVAAIAHLMTGAVSGNGISNKSSHATDPETGKPRTGVVTVSEVYVNGEAGRRATKRVEGSLVTYYYSPSHAYNTYQYQLLY